MTNIYFLSFALLSVVSNLFATDRWDEAKYYQFYQSQQQQPKINPRTIKVQTPANTHIPCSEGEAVANVFEQCRNQGQCSGPKNSLRLIFPGTKNLPGFEIKEGSEAANQRFSYFNTTSKEAFIAQEQRESAALATPAETSRMTKKEKAFFVLVAAIVGFGVYQGVSQQ
jgi:hypothetical protein